jgi:hypothetical protein
MLVREANGTFRRPGRSNEYIDGKFLNSSDVQSYIE